MAKINSFKLLLVFYEQPEVNNPLLNKSPAPSGHPAYSNFNHHQHDSLGVAYRIKETPTEFISLPFYLLYAGGSFGAINVLRLHQPSLLKLKLLSNDGLAMTRLSRNGEKEEPTTSRHYEACPVKYTSLLIIVASRSKLKNQLL